MKCKNACGTDIYFDDTVKSPKGRAIPLDVDTGEPHECPNAENQYRSLGQQVMDLEKKERNSW